MREEGNSYEIRPILPTSPDYLPALHLALDEKRDSSGHPADPVADLLKSNTAGPSKEQVLYGAYTPQGLLSACLAVISPGAAALVFVPNLPGGSDSAACACLQAICRAARQKSIRLLEALLPVGQARTAQTLRAAGFRYLTRLRYLSRWVNDPLDLRPARIDLTWASYDRDTDSLFREALLASYVQSLDCPELTDLRPITDTLTGHRATGVFEPSLWWVALYEKKPVGVILVNRVAGHPMFELVYLGVAQPSRGKGVGDAMWSRVLPELRKMGARIVTLAVDVRNDPALSMYARWGFVPSIERDAWIASSACP